MQHALIVAHPNPASFTLTMAQAYAEALSRQGHQVLMRDLYRMGFEPCLAADEVPTPKGFAPHAGWFDAPPAMLKGYIDRVFGMGFGYGMGDLGGNVPLLSGRRLISFSSSGAPKSWMVETGAWDAVRKLFDEHVAAVCGFVVMDHIHFGGIVPGITQEAVDACASEVREAAGRYFGPGQEIV
jgi:NAD(P)H dehydrogenase (quinone)